MYNQNTPTNGGTKSLGQAYIHDGLGKWMNDWRMSGMGKPEGLSWTYDDPNDGWQWTPQNDPMGGMDEYDPPGPLRGFIRAEPGKPYGTPSGNYQELDPTGRIYGERTWAADDPFGWGDIGMMAAGLGAVTGLTGLMGTSIGGAAIGGGLGGGSSAAAGGFSGMPWDPVVASGVGGSAGGGTAGAAGAAAGGVMPPNPYSLGSYFDPQNVANIFSSAANGNASGLTGLFSGSGGGGNGGFGLTDAMRLGSSFLGANRQNNASKDMLGWLNSQQGKIDNLYNPGSPEYNYLMQEMERKDAAAGRNSQYGPRSVDLAAKIAQIKAGATANLTGGTAGSRQNALTSGANAYAGLQSLLGKQTMGGTLSSMGNGFMDSVTKALGSFGSGREASIGQVVDAANYPSWLQTDAPDENLVLDMMKLWGQ